MLRVPGSVSAILGDSSQSGEGPESKQRAIENRGLMATISESRTREAQLMDLTHHEYRSNVLTLFGLPSFSIHLVPRDDTGIFLHSRQPQLSLTGSYIPVANQIATKTTGGRDTTTWKLPPTRIPSLVQSCSSPFFSIPEEMNPYLDRRFLREVLPGTSVLSPSVCETFTCVAEEVLNDIIEKCIRVCLLRNDPVISLNDVIQAFKLM